MNEWVVVTQRVFDKVISTFSWALGQKDGRCQFIIETNSKLVIGNMISLTATTMYLINVRNITRLNANPK
jgi:hypothetical protein